jgi:hypothetical protein
VIRNTRAAATGAVVLSVVISLAGCSSSHPAKVAKAPTPTPTPTPTPAVQPFTGESTGLNKPVLAVKVEDTSEARPQTGLKSADIVYCEQVEGGLTRFMAIFSSHLPKVVGPVRSARISDLDILPMFGKPALAYSGVQAPMIPLVKRTSLIDVSDSSVPNAYFRSGSRPEPHNLFAYPKRLLAAAPGASKAHDIGFRFGAAPAAGGKSVAAFSIAYPTASFSFHWLAGQRRWLIDQDGSKLLATEGGQLGGPTIVIEYTQLTRSRFKDVLGNYTPLIHTTGTGKAVVLRDGQEFQANWSRPTNKSGTTFTTAAGAPMTFATGQVWVFFVKPGKPEVP